MNTGGGKTIVGLLILQSCLNEGCGPGLYVAPSIYLAEQVIAHAGRLGISVVSDPENPRYLGGQAIGVVNIHKLVNGRSVFGGPGSMRAVPLPIGSLVIDDAHAALATTEAQSSIVLPAGHPAYDRIFELFRDELRQQSETAFLDIEAGEPSALLRVPFWAWANRSGDVARALGESRDDDALKFALPMVGDGLALSTAVFTSAGLEIRPPFPAIKRIRSFADAPRRVYLTATLPDDTVLVSGFDADSRSVERPITPSTAADLGDRLILAPQEINPAIGDETIRESLRRFADSSNVVVLVPSFRRAERWADVADETAQADDIGDIVTRLQQGHVGLVVLVNRYDGIDLPGDACRILVLDGLPDVYGGVDRRHAVVLGDSEPMMARQLQRIEQGMGRAVRSADDSCVVILLGPRLLQLLAEPRHVRHLSPATQAQLALSREVAEHLAGRDQTELDDLIEQVLKRDPSWIALSRSRLAGVTYGPGHVQPEVVHARQAFNAALIGQLDTATREMTESVNLTAEPRAKGWRLEDLALYQHFVDPAVAQNTLAAALEMNRNLTRPIRGIQYTRLTSAANQGRVASRYWRDTYPDRTRMLVGINALLDRLAFDPEQTDAFERGVEELGRHLGFTAQRPDRETGNGPDVLWAMGGALYLIIECKSGATVDRIPRHDLAQLAHSLNWFDDQYGRGNDRTPVLIHPSRTVSPNAVAPPSCRIITSDTLSRLRDAVRGMAIALAEGQAWTDETAVTNQLRTRQLTATGFIDAFSVQPRRLRPT